MCYPNKSKRTDIDQIIKEQQQELNRVKQIDNYLGIDKNKESPRENAINNYFTSLQQTTPEAKPESITSLRDTKEKMREKRGSMGFISLGKLSNKPMKHSPDQGNIASNYRKQQFHKTYNIIAHKEENEVEEDDWRLVRKQHIEYPNYDVQVSQDDIQKINDFNFKKKSTNNGFYESPSKRKDLQSFLKSVFSNKEEIAEVVKLMKDLFDANFDHRILYMLRETLIKNSKEQHSEIITVDDFRTTWRRLLKQEHLDTNAHLELKILSNLVDSSGNYIDIKKFSNIVDLIEFYPLVVKKDKNFSKELYYVLSSGTMGDHQEGLEYHKRRKNKTVDELKSEEICEFVWSKIHEKFEKLADAFRYFDADNNTKLTRKEFRDGLERMKIKLSDADREKMFSYLDKDNNGWLSYNEFCWFLEENRDPTALDTLKKFKPFFKTHKKMLKDNMIEGYGIKTEPSDNIKDVLSYEYTRELEEKQKKHQDRLLSLKNEMVKRSQDTKASMMRSHAIKLKYEDDVQREDPRFTYKLKQFINVPSSDYIRSIKKQFKAKREPGFTPQQDHSLRRTATHLLQKHYDNKNLNKSLDTISKGSRYKQLGIRNTPMVGKSNHSKLEEYLNSKVDAKREHTLNDIHYATDHYR